MPVVGKLESSLWISKAWAWRAPKRPKRRRRRQTARPAPVKTARSIETANRDPASLTLSPSFPESLNTAAELLGGPSLGLLLSLCYPGPFPAGNEERVKAFFKKSRRNSDEI